MELLFINGAVSKVLGWILKAALVAPLILTQEIYLISFHPIEGQGTILQSRVKAQYSNRESRHNTPIEGRGTILQSKVKLQDNPLWSRLNYHRPDKRETCLCSMFARRRKESKYWLELEMSKKRRTREWRWLTRSKTRYRPPGWQRYESI